VAYHVTAFASLQDEVFQDIVPGGYLFTIDGPSTIGFQTVHSSLPQYEFRDLPPGDYIFTGVRVEEDGVTPIGTPQETRKNLPATPLDNRYAIMEGLNLYGRLRYILWVPVPAALQNTYFRPGAISVWPFAETIENQAIANGERVEIIGSLRAVDVSQAEIEDALEARWTRFRDNLLAQVAWPYTNKFWTGVEWIQG
jgi:hypothetical protein